ncbi:NUDIX hydrolase [Thermopolyspora flexuosa]|uniref:NUDIX hydrolase n=1 Tax=Thermopolyspora flexuosa TaxID=103836 RepID=UPI001E48AE46|nr:NUDIX domain-containing protein [Thermopolyspora flexuosa]
MLPDGLTGRARDVLEGRAEPVPARDAATVVVLRERAPGGMQLYLLRRSASMAFAAGAHVFPGGAVDPRDADREVAWAGPSPAWWADALRCDEPTARGLVCAAVRETFEESGVLLAGPRPDAVVADTAEWEEDRLALIGRELSFAEFLARRGLVLRTDLLRPWSRWITPRVESRRYDTRFFVAALPPGQRTRDVGGEADRVAWMRPADALAAAERGEITLMPPTRRTIAEIAAYPEVGKVLAAERTVVTVAPEVVRGEDGVYRLLVPEPAGDGVREGRA